MEEARVVMLDEEKHRAWVKCPYCNSTHKHGFYKIEELDGSIKSGHCIKIETKNYRIVNPFKKKESQL